MYHQDGVEFTLEGDGIPGFLKGSRKGNIFITTSKVLVDFLYVILRLSFAFAVNVLYSNCQETKKIIPLCYFMSVAVFVTFNINECFKVISDVTATTIKSRHDISTWCTKAKLFSVV